MRTAYATILERTVSSCGRKEPDVIDAKSLEVLSTVKLPAPRTVSKSRRTTPGVCEHWCAVRSLGCRCEQKRGRGPLPARRTPGDRPLTLDEANHAFSWVYAGNRDLQC